MIHQLFPMTGALGILAMGLLFAFSNGFRDSSTIVATVVSTRALTPAKAFAWCAFLTFIGAFGLGSAVCSTIRHRFFSSLDTSNTSQLFLVLTATLLASLLWGAVSWYRAWPTSNNHALIAGLFGSGWVAWGHNPLKNSFLITLILVLILSPVIGFLLSFLITALVRRGGEWLTPRVAPAVDKLHILGCLLVSLVHGSNDGQMILGILIVGCGLNGMLPISLRFLTAGAITLGVLMGGRRILKKLGMSFYRIQSVQGLGAQLTAATTIGTFIAYGFPLSTTHVITGSILGAGAAKNLRAVKWNVVLGVALSWVITFPVVGGLACLLYLVGEKVVLK